MYTLTCAAADVPLCYGMSLLALCLLLTHSALADKSALIAAELSQTITANVTATFQKSFFFLLDAETVAKKPVRISAKALNATARNPLLVTARQILGVTSFTIPLNDQGYQGYNRYYYLFEIYIILVYIYKNAL